MQTTSEATPQPDRFMRPFTRFRGATAVAAIVGVGLTVADLLAASFHASIPLESARGWAFLGCVLLFLWLARDDWNALGLRMRPVQPWPYWAVSALAAGGIVLLAVGLWLAAAWMAGVPLRVEGGIDPDRFWSVLFAACVIAPLTEEGIYRFALCNALKPLGIWPVVLISGLTFSLLHVLYGTPWPTNLIAGFILAWAYLKSQSLFIPIALHSLGNLFVVLYNFMLP